MVHVILVTNTLHITHKLRYNLLYNIFYLSNIYLLFIILYSFILIIIIKKPQFTYFNFIFNIIKLFYNTIST